MDQKDAPIPKEFPRAPVPAVFMFQPTRFEVVVGERLREWESLLKARVGLRGDLGNLAGLATISFCDFADDCDQI